MSKKADFSEILKFLSDEDKELFISELISAIRKSKRKNNFEAIDKCLESWEATAELNSIPGLRESVWKKYEKLKKDGLLHG